MFVFIRISQCSNQAAASNMTEELGFHSGQNHDSFFPSVCTSDEADTASYVIDTGGSYPKIWNTKALS